MANYLQNHRSGSREADIWTRASGLGHGRPKLRETYRCIARGLERIEVLTLLLLANLPGGVSGQARSV